MTVESDVLLRGLLLGCSSIEQFAGMYAKKLGLKSDVLRKTIWGDYYLNMKTKRIHRGAYVRGMECWEWV